MWIFTVYGFYSVTQPASEPDSIQIRTRQRDHLTRLQKRVHPLREYKIISTRHRDYPYRLICPHNVWTKTMTALASEIDYDNFKNEAGSAHGLWGKYVSSLHKIWSLLAN